MKLQWNEFDDDRNPEFPDPLPNESTVIAKVIAATAKVIDRRGHCVDCPPCLESHDGHCPRHIPPLTQQQREDLADEIEFDLL